MKRKIIIFLYLPVAFSAFSSKRSSYWSKKWPWIVVEYHASHSVAISDPDRSIIKNRKYPEASETICFLLENVFRAFTCWSLCSDPGSVMRISYGS